MLSSSSKEYSKDRERELVKSLVARKQEGAVKVVLELLNLRLLRCKDRLVDDNSDTLRGRAMELRDMLKLFVDTTE